MKDSITDLVGSIHARIESWEDFESEKKVLTCVVEDEEARLNGILHRASIEELERD